MKFKIGDRVRVKDKFCGFNLKGKTGTIIGTSSCWDWCVEFDEPFEGGHDGTGGKDGYCRYGNSSELELIKRKFKIGDKVIGNEKANRYGITREGWFGKVVGVKDDVKIEVRSGDGSSFWVDPDCFNLYEEKPVKKSFKRESDYKVGDKVRIVGNDHFPSHGFSIGEVVEIKRIDCGANTCLCEDGKGKTQYVHPSCFEFVKEEKGWRIEIVPDGEETTATLYKRGKAVKSATVKRYKGDEYSIADAADYAVQKLFEKKKEKKAKEEKYKVGDRVRITSQGGGKCIRHNFHIGEEVVIKEGPDGDGDYWCKDENGMGQYVHPSCFEPVKERKFEVGARVVGVGSFEGKKIEGCIGIIREKINDNRWGVEFEENIDGHRLAVVGEGCKKGHGWYCDKDSLKLI